MKYLEGKEHPKKCMCYVLVNTRDGSPCHLLRNYCRAVAVTMKCDRRGGQIGS
jgi:hypothetical protein